MVSVAAKLGRYDSRNHRFRKAYIRERLAEIKQQREALTAERERANEALRASADPAPPYSSENMLFRKAYIRDRMDALKEERQALVKEREATEVGSAAGNLTDRQSGHDGLDPLAQRH